MAKTRIFTARLKFSPRKAKCDATEADIVHELNSVLCDYEALKVETVLDRDPLPSLFAAFACLKHIVGTLESKAGEAGDTIIRLDVNDILPEANEAIRQVMLSERDTTG